MAAVRGTSSPSWMGRPPATLSPGGVTSHDVAQFERFSPRAGCWLTPRGDDARHEKCTVRAGNWRWVLRRHVPVGHNDSGDATLTGSSRVHDRRNEFEPEN
jgi:hypothetical protein